MGFPINHVFPLPQKVEGHIIKNVILQFKHCGFYYTVYAMIYRKFKVILFVILMLDDCGFFILDKNNRMVK